MRNDHLNAQRPPVRLLALGVLVLGLAACADMGSVTPQAALRGATAAGVPKDAGQFPAVQAQWWTAFGDAQLNALITQALADNPSLKLAQARIGRAIAASGAVDATGQPQLGAGVDLTRQLFTANGLYPPPLAGTIRETGTAQLSGSWELDFFGKNRAALDAALGSVQAARADAQAARVLLATNVARSYFQLLRLNEQLAVARRTLAQREQSLGLVRERLQAGLDTRLELRQSEGTLPEARQQIELLQEQITLGRHALGALVGRVDAADAIALPAMTGLRALPPAHVIPADLLGRRADIAAARWRVEAATQDVANAKTQFYPNINLVAFAGFSSIGFGKLLESGSQQWGVGPALRLPIFDGGRLRANLGVKTSDLDAAVESYNSAVIDAVRDTADQIASAQAIARQQNEQRATQAAAESAYEIALQRYQAGLSNYLQVLASESAVLAQRRLAVDLAARALDTQVALVRALGGGWQPDAAHASVHAAPSGAEPDVAIKSVVIE